MKLVKHKIKPKPFLQHLPPLASAFLSSLIANENEMNELLNPVLKSSSDDCVLAFRQTIGKKVIVCGDFDADGIISTTLLVRYLRKMKVECGYYIPNRLTEGYGTSLKTVQMAHQKGYDTIIMLDNGVKPSLAHDYCLENDLTLIVIDHHQISVEVDCDLLIHPDVMDSYFEKMCSAGLVYTLMGSTADDYDLVLAGIATIGDMMDLRKQNRALVYHGLRLLNQQKFMTIEALLKRPVDKWDASVIAFQIVPVFNALGRLSDLGNVNTIVSYLLSDDLILINQFSKQLKNINQQRKNLTASQTQMALEILDEHHDFVMTYHPDFHPGIVGIIAGQLSNSLNKPALVFSGSQTLKGSVRATGFNVYQFLQTFEARYFLSFGGHESACALSISQSDYLEFKAEVNQAIQEVEIKEASLEVLVLDYDDMTLSAYRTLLMFEPFGQGFKLMPLYLEANIIGVRQLGQAGYLLQCLAVGEVREILYFKKDLIITDNNFRVGAVGDLQINQKGDLSLIATHLFVL